MHVADVLPDATCDQLGGLTARFYNVRSSSSSSNILLRTFCCSPFFFSRPRAACVYIPSLVSDLVSPLYFLCMFVYIGNACVRIEGNLLAQKRWRRRGRPTALSATTAWNTRCSCRASTSSAASASPSGEGLLDQRTVSTAFVAPLGFSFVRRERSDV